MDQARSWMLSKRKSDFIHLNSLAPATSVNSPYAYGDSWEEQAFAEDTSGALGGCVWPPRSYSCTFCRREFKSAQALGGHMNVHRRDRARLKQQSPNPEDHHPQTHVPNDHPIIDSSPYSPHMCAFLYNNPINPKLSDPWNSPPSNVIRVSSSPDGSFSSEEKMSSFCFFSPVVQKFSRHRQSWLIKDDEESKRSIGRPPVPSVEKEDCDTAEDISTCLSLVTSHHQTQANASSEEEVGSFKRRRIHEAKPFFLPNSSLVDRCLNQSEMFSGLSEEVLDLELKLGDGPKVK